MSKAKKTMNPSRELMNVLTAIYGEKAKIKAVNADLQFCEFDRYGTQIKVILIDGSIICGRLSKSHNFNGYRLEHGKTTKHFRSYRA